MSKVSDTPKTDSPRIVLPPNGPEWFDDPISVQLVGRKARGLSLFPAAWRPVFFVLTTRTYTEWAADQGCFSNVLIDAAESIETVAKSWRTEWPRGLILRSSAENETLEDRGANVSLRLAADFSTSQIRDALEAMFRSYSDSNATGSLAVVVQPLVGAGPMGHLSNERRVSKTVNQWSWEQIFPESEQGRLNSQRDTVPNVQDPLTARANLLVRKFGAVGRWVTGLDHGPAHLEWIYDGKTLWLLQIDFEHEQPDEGVDPGAWLREMDHLPAGPVRTGSALILVDLALGSGEGPWRKIDNVKRFAASRQQPYPSLAAITGERFSVAVTTERKELELDLEQFAHGRVVCRTDCKAFGISRENLPRTSTVSSRVAVDQMGSFLKRMTLAGAMPEDICFLIHKFIPAQVGVWVRADPHSTIVRVDSLWGVPDGLQYLPHDTFDVDVRRKAVLSERLRYKPRFVQECPDGTWQELKVRRALGRARSLSAADAIDVSIASHEIASRQGKSLLIMWFCGVPQALGIGQNLPWFSMPPNPTPTLVGDTISPRWPREIIRNDGDLELLLTSGAARRILVLDPELALFRDDAFISRVIGLAKRDHCPVQIAGSSLAHAYYQLEKAGISVLPADGPTRTRVRGKRTYSKLVRNELPSQIASGGEIVLQSRLSRTEMRRALVAKIFEEAQELLTSTDPDDVKAEIADLLEVVRAIASTTGVAWAEVAATADSKRARRGGFEDGAILVGTEWPGSNRTAQRPPPLVTLRSLGKVSTGATSTKVSYNAILASEDGVTVRVGKQLVTVRLTAEGVCLESVGRDKILPSQLSFPFLYD